MMVDDTKRWAEYERASFNAEKLVQQMQQQQETLYQLDTEIRAAIAELESYVAGGALPPEKLVVLLLKLSTATLILINRTRLPF